MLRILIMLLFLTPLNAHAELITKGISSSFLKKIKSDGDIKNSFINEKSLEIGFNTRTKLWVWNIKDNKLKSIKIENSSLRSSEINNIYFYEPYWIVESHNRLIFIDLVEGTKKHLIHPKINQGYSLGLEKDNKSLYWAHTDGSIKIDLKKLNMDFYTPPIMEEIHKTAQIASDIFFIKNKLVFKVSHNDMELIFHSPRKIHDIVSDKDYLMISTKDSVIQLSPRGKVIKTISHQSNNKLMNFKITKKSFHCFLFEDGSIKSFNLIKKTMTDFKLNSNFNISDYDCRGQIAVISNKDNILILAQSKKKNYSTVKPRSKKL